MIRSPCGPGRTGILGAQRGYGEVTHGDGSGGWTVEHCRHITGVDRSAAYSGRTPNPSVMRAL